jgi:hypothetical protein
LGGMVIRMPCGGVGHGALLEPAPSPWYIVTYGLTFD